MVTETVTNSHISQAGCEIPALSERTRPLLASGNSQERIRLFDMSENMKKTYRIIARHDRGGEHLQNTETGERESLETSDRDETQRICDARNLETQAPFLSLKIGYKLEMQSAAYNVIRKKPIAATQAEDLRLVLKGAGARQTITCADCTTWHWITDGYIIIPPKKWPKSPKRPQRGISFEEYERIT